jgi:hypothetical protein
MNDYFVSPTALIADGSSIATIGFWWGSIVVSFSGL